MNTTEPIKAFDPVWEEVHAAQEWGKYPPEHVIRFVARNFYKVTPRHSVRILDLGAGQGACTWYMAREGFSVSAIEGSRSAVDKMLLRLAQENLRCETVCGDIASLPWADRTFDAVIDNATLCCNTPAACEKIIGEVHRVLKPGGKFLSCNFTPHTWGYGCGERISQGCFKRVSEGPLAGKGLQFFMSPDDIWDLYAPFSAGCESETISYSMEQNTKTVESWVITATK